VEASYLDFDESGQVRASLIRGAFDAIQTFPDLENSKADLSKVFDPNPKLNRDKRERENRWTPNQQELDLIADHLSPNGIDLRCLIGPMAALARVTSRSDSRSAASGYRKPRPLSNIDTSVPRGAARCGFRSCAAVVTLANCDRPSVSVSLARKPEIVPRNASTR
jgi:hypothetical protein